MPIEIKELTIKIDVTPTKEKPNKSLEASGLTPAAHKQIIKECVEEVLSVLEDKLDR